MWVLKILNLLYTLSFSLQNAVWFIMLTSLVPVLFKFNIQSVLKLKKYFRNQRVKHNSSALCSGNLLLVINVVTDVTFLITLVPYLPAYLCS